MRIGGGGGGVDEWHEVSGVVVSHTENPNPVPRAYPSRNPHCTFRIITVHLWSLDLVLFATKDLVLVVRLSIYYVGSKD